MFLSWATFVRADSRSWCEAFGSHWRTGAWRLLTPPVGISLLIWPGGEVPVYTDLRECRGRDYLERRKDLMIYRDSETLGWKCGKNRKDLMLYGLSGSRLIDPTLFLPSKCTSNDKPLIKWRLKIDRTIWGHGLPPDSLAFRLGISLTPWLFPSRSCEALRKADFSGTASAVFSAKGCRGDRT